MPDTDIQSPIRIKHPDRLFIGGKWVAPAKDGGIDVISPNTEEVFIRVAEAREADIDRAVAAARKAFDHGPWPRMSHAERAAKLKEVANHLRARNSEAAHVWTEQMGALASFTKNAGIDAAKTFDYYADMAATFSLGRKSASRAMAAGSPWWCASRWVSLPRSAPGTGR